jgi:hypothetical protein
MSKGIELKDNANFISAKENKELNGILAEYYTVSEKVKDLSKTIERLKPEIKKAGVIGIPNQTTDYEFLLSQSKGGKRLDSKKLAELYPEIAKDERLYTDITPSIKLEWVKKR